LTRRPRLLVELAILLGAAAVLALAAFFLQRLVFRHDLPTPEIARSMDAALGPIILRQVELTEHVLDDQTVDSAFTAIMDRLQPALRQLAPDAPKVKIVVIDSPQVNAFALPGGIVCVYTGLIRAVASADQMAGILAHELSHVSSRDPLALLARQVGMAALAGLLTGGQGEGLPQTLARTLVNVHYGREAEDRADEFAVRLLAAASVDPAAFAGGLVSIRKASPKNPSLLRWIDTHSPIDERISRAREQARALSVKARRIGVKWRSVVASLPGEDSPRR